MMVYLHGIPPRKMVGQFERALAEAATGGVYKKGVLKNFAKFTGKHLCQRLFFNKVTGLSLQIFKKHLFYRAPPGDCFCLGGP